MIFTPRHLPRTRFAFGNTTDPVATDSTGEWSIVSLLKGCVAQAVLHGGAITPDPVVARPRNVIRDPAETIGAQDDPVATNTTGSWTMVSLLKGLLEEAE